MLEQLLKRYGGIQQWRAYRTAGAVFRDDCKSWFWRWIAMPWPQNNTLLQFEWIVGSDTSSLTFLNGKKQGETWDIQRLPLERRGHPSRLGGQKFTEPESGFVCELWYEREADMFGAEHS